MEGGERGDIQVAAGWRSKGRLRRSIEVASGRRWRQTRSPQDGGFQPGRQRRQISRVDVDVRFQGRRRRRRGEYVGRHRWEYPGCSKDGAHRVAAGWWSVGRRMMEVPGSRQNGGLQVAAGWRSPGRRRMEVSRSPQDGGFHVIASLQVIAVGWRSL